VANVTITVLGDLRYRVKKTGGINWSSVARKAFSLGHTLETIAVTRQCVVRMNGTGRVKGRKEIPRLAVEAHIGEHPDPMRRHHNPQGIQ